ncbi:MAG: double-strand break repair helicase AddA [Rhodomicrobium sp.]
MTETLPDQAQLLAAAEEKQGRAADPGLSAWLRANAGTGKTHVLVQRILRLLLSGANPRSILCLTFTKNAAAEMEARVLDKLGEWATCSHEDLKAKLSKLLARDPAEADIALARCLFATVIDAPGGLAIMTIHGFCERVLRRYSFEANVPPGFAVLTEEEARDALQEASAGAFASPSLREALECVAAHAGEGEFARVLQAMLAKRLEIAQLLSVTAEEHPLPAIEARLRRLFNLALKDTREGLIARSAALADASMLNEAVAALSGGTKTDCDGAVRFEAARRAVGNEAICTALKAAFTTKSGEPRKSLMTAAVKKRAEALHERLSEAQDAFLALDEKICSLKLVEASIALLRLTEAIFERYEAAKRARTALDFDDLIGKTSSLLTRQEAAEWVLYELDARIDHILVDEAQDTNPGQWTIVERLTSDFFTGAGARDCVPTLFVVGDEKQSIYGFQGAKPELLQAFGVLYEQTIREAGFSWCEADLDLSFRTLGPILTAVDRVSAALPGLQQGQIRHLAYRRDAGGLVELWQPERGEKEDKGSVWEPDAPAAPVAKPAQALAARIAAQIKRWLVSGDSLASRGRAIEPGDILILLRKREPLAKLIQTALKVEGVPVAGTDRIALIDELAVMDLLALADSLLQPEDDLTLATVLKSPLLGASEDDLFKLAYGRECSIWQSLQRDPDFRPAVERLSRWRELARKVSPFDFFAYILEAEKGREAFGARLGAECFDAIDEFLALAGTFSARPLASLGEFVVFARKSASEVKRETEQAAREVRIMTVHGAKGLEANIVILADTCGNKGAASAPLFFLDDRSGAPRIPVWAVKGTGGLRPIAGEKDEIKAGEQRELGRLLYVAMTRARDRLYIAGFHNGSLPAGSWYETIQTALAPVLQEGQDFQGRTVWRTGPAQEFRAPPHRAANQDGAGLPVWLTAPARQERPLTSLSPSRLMQNWGAGPASSRHLPESDRKTAQTRGTLIHRLLEILPALAPEHRPHAARLIASAFSGELGAQQRQDAVARALALLPAGALAQFETNPLSEAGLGVTILDAKGERIASILGQPDRIHLSEGRAAVIDYKSGALPAGAEVTRAHLAQLACYRLALQRIYPHADVRASLLNTSSGKTVEAAGEDIDAVLEEVLAKLT